MSTDQNKVNLVTRQPRGIVSVCRTRLAVGRLAVGAVLVATLAVCPASAMDEQLGPTSKIAEPDLLQEIYANLREKEASGELKRLEQEGIARAKKSAVEPNPVAGLKRTKEERRFNWDPSAIADKDVKDHNGKVIVAKGTRMNPLEIISLPQNFLFFDGRDAEQVEFARYLLGKYKGGIKPIMTAGNITDVAKTLNRRMYFDQGGYLIGRFGITQVPAMVSQEKDAKVLRVDEMLVPTSYGKQEIVSYPRGAAPAEERNKGNTK